MSTTHLPKEFMDLQPLADVFAVSDDVQRTQVEAAASGHMKRRLVEEVRPRFTEINDYLNSKDDESAHLLGRLAEAACEVITEIEPPNNTKCPG